MVTIGAIGATMLLVLDWSEIGGHTCTMPESSRVASRYGGEGENDTAQMDAAWPRRSANAFPSPRLLVS